MGMRGGHHHYHNQHQSSSSSSIDSNTNDHHDDHHRRYRPGYHDGNYPSSATACSSSSLSSTKDLSTDLRLGLSISPLYGDRGDLPSSSSSNTREQYSDWPPITPFLRSTLGERSTTSISRRDKSLFVKVYMEGIPIGRKLDLLAHDDYGSMVTILSPMFKTTILYSDVVHPNSCQKCYFLTYEDKEGDWMMVGDVPWEMFLNTVRRLKITTLDKCYQYVIFMFVVKAILIVIITVLVGICL